MSAGAAPLRRPPPGFLARRAAGLRAVLERDFLVLTSLGRFVALRTAVVVAIAFVAGTTLVAMQVADARSPDMIGRGIMSAFVFAYPLVVQLLAPALAAGAIAGERSLDTLPIVLAAPVRPGAFVLAKFLSRLGALAVPLLGGLPIAGLCFLYGGIDVVLFGQWAVLVASLAVVATAGAILASAYARTVATAVIAAYFVGVALPWLESWAAIWAATQVFDASATTSLLATHTPAMAFGTVIGGVFGRGTATGSVLPFAAAAVLFAALCLVLAAARVSREAAAMAGGGPRRGAVRRAWSANPVLDRATLALPFRRGGWRSLLAVAAVAGLTWIFPLVDELRDDDLYLVGLNFCTWTTFFVVVARASQALAVERQQGSLAVLRTTPLDAAAIVRGKLAGLGLQTALLLLPGVALAITGAALDEIELGCLLTWLASTAAALFFFCALAVRVSATAETSAKAAGLSFGLCLGLMMAHGLGMLLFMMAGGSRADEWAVAPFLTATPPAFVGILAYTPHNRSVSSSEVHFLAWSVVWASVTAGLGFALARRAAAALRVHE